MYGIFRPPTQNSEIVKSFTDDDYTAIISDLFDNNVRFGFLDECEMTHF